MDTSKEYIRMARMAVEVQEKWVPQFGDWFFDEEIKKMAGKLKKELGIAALPHLSGIYCYQEGTMNCECCGEEFDLLTFDKFYPQSDVIWLIRQDQLQDMYRKSIPAIILLHKFKEWAYKEHEGLTSMEQLWLAFVMHEKYGKKWDGEDWIIEPQTEAETPDAP